MTMTRAVEIRLDPASLATLEALQKQHKLDSRSAAVRLVLAAIAPHVIPGASSEPAVVRGGPSTKAQQVASRKHIFDLRRVPIKHRASICEWVNSGARPDDPALQALARSHLDQLWDIGRLFPGFQLEPAASELPSRKHLFDLRLVPIGMRAEVAAWVSGGAEPCQETIWQLYQNHPPANIEKAFGPQPEPPAGPFRSALRQAFFARLRVTLQAYGQAAAADDVLFW